MDHTVLDYTCNCSLVCRRILEASKLNDFLTAFITFLNPMVVDAYKVQHQIEMVLNGLASSKVGPASENQESRNGLDVLLSEKLGLEMYTKIRKMTCTMS